jgi:hypothetical protein
MKIKWKEIHSFLKFHKSVSFRAIAVDLDIPPSTFTRLKKGKAISAQALVQILWYLKTNFDMELWPFVARKRS